MKKSVLIPLVVVLAGAYPAAAWYIGRNVESELTGYANKVTTQVPYVKVVKRDYQRGVYSSTETVTYELMGDMFRALSESLKGPQGDGGAKADIKPLTFTVRNQISHGPWTSGKVAAATIDSELVFGAETQKEVAKLFGDKKPLSAHTVISFGGGGTSTLASPPFATDLPARGEGGGPSKIAWQGLTVKVDFTKEMASYTADGSAPKFELTDDKGGKITMAGIALKADATRVYPDEPMLYAGKQTMSVAELSMEGIKEAQSVKIKNVVYVADAKAEGDFLDMAGRFSAETVNVNDANYGPAHYDIAMKRLHGRTVVKLYKSMMQLYSTGELFKRDPGDPTAALAPLKEPMIELLKHNPEFHLERVSFKTPDGEAMLSARAKLNGANAQDFANPMALIPKLEAGADIALPLSLLARLSGSGADPEQAQTRKQMFEQQVTAMEEQGYIIRADKVLKSKLEFKAGALTVNGKPFNPGGGLGEEMPPGADPEAAPEPEEQARPMPKRS